MMRKWISLPGALAAGCLMSLVASATAQEVIVSACPGGSCQAGCQEGCTKTVCRPTMVNKEVKKRFFDDRRVEFCLPCCLSHKNCGCSKVHVRKELILHVRKCEKCVKKCVPVPVPTCTTPCAGPTSLPEAPIGQSAPVALPGQIPVISPMSSTGPMRMPAAN